MLRRHSALVALVCVVAAWSAFGQDSGDKKKSEDEKLIAAVKAAAEKGVEPQKVDAAVGAKSTRNTFRDDDREIFDRVSIVQESDPKLKLHDRGSILWIAYWGRPIESRDAKVIGIAWPKEGKAQVFTGYVLPP